MYNKEKEKMNKKTKKVTTTTTGTGAMMSFNDDRANASAIPQ